MCQQDTPLPNQGIDGLKTNIIIRNLAKQVRLARMQNEQSQCESNSASKCQHGQEALAKKLMEKQKELDANLVNLRRRRNDWKQNVDRTLKGVSEYSTKLIDALKSDTQRKKQEIHYRNNAQMRRFADCEREITQMIEDVAREYSAVSTNTRGGIGSGWVLSADVKAIELCHEEIPRMRRRFDIQFVSSGAHLREDLVGKVIMNETKID